MKLQQRPVFVTSQSQLSVCERKLSGKPLPKENFQMCQFVSKFV